MYTQYPSQISIETFHGCNARCTFCHVNEWSRKAGEMTDEIFEKIVEQLKPWAKKYIKQTSLMLNGEPLYDKKLEKRIKLCKMSGIPNVGFTTNAALFNSKRIETIVESDPDYIVLSFDTLDKNDYEAGRLRLKYEKVKNNIIDLINLRNKVGSKIRIVVRHIDLKGDKKDFAEYLDFFRNYLNEKDEIGYTKLHNAAFTDSIKENFNSQKFYGNTPCGAVFNRLTIQHDGQVVLCPHDFNGEYNFGNIMKDNILNIYNNKQFLDIRKIHSEKKRSCMKKCDKCDEPEINADKDMYAKYTVSGKRFFANVFTGFDREQEIKKIQE